MYQVRWYSGEIKEFEDMREAWDRFLGDDFAWKISWSTLTGGRMRIVKEVEDNGRTSLSGNYVDDLIEDGLKERGVNYGSEEEDEEE